MTIFEFFILRKKETETNLQERLGLHGAGLQCLDGHVNAPLPRS